MRVIKGTGDARLLQKGLIQTTTARTLKCTRCGGQAAATSDPRGGVSYTCPKCKAVFKMQAM